MRLLVIMLFLIAIKVFANDNLAGKSLICGYGKNKDFYEAYLFFKDKYVSKFLFLEKNKFRIRQNEKKHYFLSNDFINLKPFKINRKNLQVIDTEYDEIVGLCHIAPSHEKAAKFMNDFLNRTQESYNKILEGYEI